MLIMHFPLSVMYKYVGAEDGSLSLVKHQTTETIVAQLSKQSGPLVKSKKITKFCNNYKDIRPGGEGN